eukprot:2690748-Pyramimonas_sp.AAC.1
MAMPMPMPMGETHANCAIGILCGAHFGATRRCTGWGRRMRTAPMEPSVAHPLGPRNAVLTG